MTVWQGSIFSFYFLFILGFRSAKNMEEDQALGNAPQVSGIDGSALVALAAAMKDVERILAPFKQFIEVSTGGIASGGDNNGQEQIVNVPRLAFGGGHNGAQSSVQVAEAARVNVHEPILAPCGTASNLPSREILAMEQGPPQPRDPTVQEVDGNAPVRAEQKSKRALQQVSTVATRKDVVAWMIGDEAVHGKQNLMARTVDAFPSVFRSKVRNTNLVKAARWWKSQGELFPNDDESTSPDEGDSASPQFTVARARLGKQRRSRIKSAQGRGPKRAPWVTWLYSELLSEFERLHGAGVQISSKLLQNLACDVLVNSNSMYDANYRDQKDGKLIVDKITFSWVQQFMAVHNIVLSQRGTSREGTSAPK